MKATKFLVVILCLLTFISVQFLPCLSEVQALSLTEAGERIIDLQKEAVSLQQSMAIIEEMSTNELYILCLTVLYLTLKTQQLMLEISQIG